MQQINFRLYSGLNACRQSKTDTTRGYGHYIVEYYTAGRDATV